MNICEEAERCEVRICPHAEPHDEKTEPDNDCATGCDVDGGIAAAVCTDI